MTDPNRPTPAPDGDAGTGATDPRSASDEVAVAHDPLAEGHDSGAFGGVRSGADPDGLDQSVGRESGDQGDARTRDGAI